jgi:hypothetical protein
MKLLLLPVALMAAPCLLGRPWARLLPDRRGLRALACWPLGYLMMLALFEALAVPFTWLRGDFHNFAVAYTAVLAAAAAASVLLPGGRKPLGASLRGGGRLSFWEGLYLAAFLVLLGFQLVRAAVWDTTTMNYDDSDYLARAADALAHGLMLGVDPETGLAEALSMKRVMQGSLFFPAWVSWLSGLPVTVAARSVLETVHLALAYAAFGCMALTLFPKRENALIFLLLLSLAYLVGHYSHYSPAFRLFGPNYQGKAMLAILLCPMLFTLMMILLERAYDWRYGLMLMALSLAAVSMTLFGAPVMAAGVGVPALLSLVRRPRQWKRLLYVLWASAIPAACGAAYLWVR